MDIAISLLSANFADLANHIRSILKQGADRLHVDVMDHHYVSQLTFGPIVCQHLLQALSDFKHIPIDVHLMTEQPHRLFQAFANVRHGFDMTVTFHPLCSQNVIRDLNKLHELDLKTGLAINPDESFDTIIPLLDTSLLDQLLVMTVPPGKAGQTFMREPIDRLKTLASHHSLPYVVVDGGINDQTITQLKGAPIDAVVSGSFVFGHSTPKNAIASLRVV